MTSPLKTSITETMKTAMRAKDTERLGTIRMALAAIKQKEVDERISLDDAAVVAIVDKLIKQRKEAITAYKKADRIDLVDKEQAEIAVLSAYLPQRLDAKQIATEVETIIQELVAASSQPLGPTDIGKVMVVAKTRLAKQAEMGLVSAAVKAALSAG